jgi:hypothetical protein
MDETVETATVVGLSADGTLPVDRGRAGLIRVEIEMFA